jgi:hypothetical protein
MLLKCTRIDTTQHCCAIFVAVALEALKPNQFSKLAIITADFEPLLFIYSQLFA